MKKANRLWTDRVINDMKKLIEKFPEGYVEEDHEGIGDEESNENIQGEDYSNENI